MTTEHVYTLRVPILQSSGKFVIFDTCNEPFLMFLMTPTSLHMKYIVAYFMIVCIHVPNTYMYVIHVHVSMQTYTGHTATPKFYIIPLAVVSSWL